MSDTIYMYEKESGRIKYTIDNAQPMQVGSLIEKGETFFFGPSGGKLSGTYVKLDNEGNPSKIVPIEHMTFININKHTIVADGEDEAVVSGLRHGMHVNINNEHSYVVDDESGTSLELTCNNYSYMPQHNEMTVYFKSYGCHDSQIKINMIEG